MSINNDQHIIRDVMLGLEELVEENPKIIYCYYDERDKADFEKQYESAITFSKEVNRRVREIEVEYIKTQDVVQRHRKSEGNYESHKKRRQYGGIRSQQDRECDPQGERGGG